MKRDICKREKKEGGRREDRRMCGLNRSHLSIKKLDSKKSGQIKPNKDGHIDDD